MGVLFGGSGVQRRIFSLSLGWYVQILTITFITVLSLFENIKTRDGPTDRPTDNDMSMYRAAFCSSKITNIVKYVYLYIFTNGLAKTFSIPMHADFVAHALKTFISERTVNTPVFRTFSAFKT